MSSTPLLSVVVPAWNEEGVLAQLIQELQATLVDYDHELIVVNDGSTDGSGELLDALAAGNPTLKVLHLSRNFGHQAAILAGLRHAQGEAVVLMDADLQDRPSAIPAMVERWREGYDVVYARRVGRKEGIVKRALFHAFYRVLNAVSQTPMPNDAGNFGLVGRRVSELIAHTIERDRYYAGLRRWMGFRQIGVEVERDARYDGRARVTLGGLFRLAKSAIFSFSTVPLAVFYVIAALSGLVFAGLAGFTLYHRMITGLAIPGWTSTIMTACFFGALNALGIGILGEYVMRIYDQVRARPQFIVERAVNLDGEPRTDTMPPPGSRA